MVVTVFGAFRITFRVTFRFGIKSFSQAMLHGVPLTVVQVLRKKRLVSLHEEGPGEPQTGSNIAPLGVTP